MAHDLFREAADDDMGQAGEPERAHDDRARPAGGCEDRAQRVGNDDPTRDT
jgi:hypothetical protein